MVIRIKSKEEIEAEEKRAPIVLSVILVLFISLCYLIKEADRKSPDYQLRQYQAEISQIEYENKVKADTEAARLKLKQLHEQRLKELENENGSIK